MSPSPFKQRRIPLLATVSLGLVLAIAACTGSSSPPDPDSSASSSAQPPSPGPSDLWADPDLGVRYGFAFMYGLCANLPWPQLDDLGELVTPSYGDNYRPEVLIRCTREIKNAEGALIGSAEVQIYFRSTVEQAKVDHEKNSKMFDIEPEQVDGWDEAGVGAYESWTSEHEVFVFLGRTGGFTLQADIALLPDAAADHPESKLLDLTRLLATTAHDLSLAD